MILFSASRISSRHHFLEDLIGTKPEEDISYIISRQLAFFITISMVTLSALEAIFHHLYNTKVIYNLPSFLQQYQTIFEVSSLDQNCPK